MSFLSWIFNQKKQSKTVKRVHNTEVLTAKNNYGLAFKSLKQAEFYFSQNLEINAYYKVAANFDNSVDAERALLNTKLFFKAADTGKICCKRPYLYGCNDEGNSFISFVLSASFEENDFDLLISSFNNNNGYDLKINEPVLKI